MKLNLQVLCLLIFLGVIHFRGIAQQITISGFIKSSESKETLPFASIYNSLSQKGIYSNEYGFFSYSTSVKEVIKLRFSYTGYKVSNFHFKGTKDTSLIIFLRPEILREVMVNAQQKVNEGIHGLALSPSFLKQLPVVGGEPDLIKSLTFLPGVSNGFEGLAGMFVRGGELDQNLYLLDGASIYNTGHLFNFVSVYNSAAIKKVTFFKGNFPAKYGGRLASVTDIQFKDGNKSSLKGQANIGLINSNFSVEAPLGDNKKASFLLSARSMYLDLFSIGLRKKVRNREKQSYTGLSFFDINAKLNYEFSKKDKFFLNLYVGKDYYRLLESYENVNGYNKKLTNFSASLLYYKALTAKLFFKINGAVSGYTDFDQSFDEIYDSKIFYPTPQNPSEIYRIEYNLKEKSESIKSNYTYNYSSKIHFDYSPSLEHNISFGTELLQHFFQPFKYKQIDNVIEFNGEETTSQFKISKPLLTAFEAAFYIEDDIQPTANWTIRPGLRYSYFKSDSTHFSTLEPRFSLSYTPNVSTSFFAGISRNAQYLFSINGYNTEIAKSVWIPTSKQHPPQTAWLYSVGSKKNWKNHKLNISLELFYKNMYELKQYGNNYEEGVPYANWEKNILNGGRGKTYGVETSIGKQKNKWNFAANYTLSWNKRKFKKLNNGEWFLAKYDRRHDFNFLITYKKNKYWTFTAAWFFATGHRVTLPIAKIPENSILHSNYAFDGIYSYKLPNYHRLDISAKWEKQSGKHKNIRWMCSFDIYNAYYRKNINDIHFQPTNIVDRKGNIIETAGIKGTSLFPIIPSINVGIKF